MTTHVELQHDGHVSRVRFVGEKGIQLLASDTRQQLTEAVRELETREECRVAVFEAEGRTFIAGADIKELQQLSSEAAIECAREMHTLFGRIERLPAVTIAAIHAACAGGGFELALACDLRLAAESAKIGLPETSLGLIPGWGGTVRVTKLFGPAVAKFVICRGELFPARKAALLGLVHEVASDAEFPALLQQQIDTILKRSPAAIRTAKRLIADITVASGESAFELEAESFGECYESPDAAEGIAAFLEKRPPEWS